MAAGEADGDGESSDRFRAGSAFDLEELRRRNAGAVAMDALYLFTTAFFASLAVRGFWPAVMAALPLAIFLYFAWRSSLPFFLAQIAVVVLTAIATVAGLVPF